MSHFVDDSKTARDSTCRKPADIARQGRG